MKKTFMAPTVSTVDIKAENAILGASGITGGNATSGGEGGVIGGNGGDALAKMGGFGSLGRTTSWSMGKLDF